MAKVSTNPRKIKELLSLGVSEVLIKKDLQKKLTSGRVLRIKHGVDPTSKDLHLGYAVVYHKLREFQELGHKIVFLIGGFTGRFGDPTDKDKKRELRSKTEVHSLSKNYLKQLSKILDINQVEVRNNSEWYDKWSFEQGLRLLSKFTVARMLERDMFVKRQQQQKEIYYHEPVYPMLQGWDSVEIKSDATVIGLDQKFNELQARPLQEEQGQKPQDIVAVPLLVGTDGKMKMSQSLGNHIGLDDSPADQFGKIMSMPDEALLSYFELAARYNEQQLLRVKQELKEGKNPKDLKIELAKAIVTMYHSSTAANQAAKDFYNLFSQKNTSGNLPVLQLEDKQLSLLDFLTNHKFCVSRGEARRLIQQGGLKINNKKILQYEQKYSFKSGDVVQIGKKKFVKIK